MSRRCSAPQQEGDPRLIETGVKGFGDLEKKITGTNSAFDMYDRQMDTTASKFKMFKSAMQETFLNVFDTIKPIIDKLIESATRFITQNQDKIRGFMMDIIEFAIRAGGWFEKAWVRAGDGWRTFWESVRDGANILGKALGLLVGDINELFMGDKTTRSYGSSKRTGRQDQRT